MEIKRTPPHPWRLRQRAKLSRGEVAFDLFGEGPPLVLVHGTPTWSYLWRNIAPALTKHFTVYALDLLGFGDSERRPGQDVSIRAQAHVLTELLELWQLDVPTIAGHDIGGAIALRTHLLHQVAFSRIALLDAVVLRPWITPTSRHVQAHLEAYQTMPTHIYEQVVATHLRTAVHQSMDEAAFAAYFSKWQGKSGQLLSLQKIAQFDEEHTAEFEPLLASMQTPVRLIWGERDAWLTSALAKRLHELLPNSELRLIPDAGHFVMEDRPDAVARELVNFFTTGSAES